MNNRVERALKRRIDTINGIVDECIDTFSLFDSIGDDDYINASIDLYMKKIESDLNLYSYPGDIDTLVNIVDLKDFRTEFIRLIFVELENYELENVRFGEAYGDL